MAKKGSKQPEEWRQKMSKIMKSHIKAFKKGSVPWNKGIHTKGFKMSEESKEKIRQSKLELYKDKTRHPAYKFGVSHGKQYTGIHTWLKKKYGKPYMCENRNCCKKSKRFDYAKLPECSHEPNRKNYITLCRICHTKLDKKSKDFILTLKK